MGCFFLAQGSFLAHHERKIWFVTVARGPVPRDLSTQQKHPQREDYGRFQKIELGEGQALALLLASAHPRKTSLQVLRT